MNQPLRVRVKKNIIKNGKKRENKTDEDPTARVNLGLIATKKYPTKLRKKKKTTRLHTNASQDSLEWQSGNYWNTRQTIQTESKNAPLFSHTSQDSLRRLSPRSLMRKQQRCIGNIRKGFETCTIETSYVIKTLLEQHIDVCTPPNPPFSILQSHKKMAHKYVRLPAKKIVNAPPLFP